MRLEAHRRGHMAVAVSEAYEVLSYGFRGDQLHTLGRVILLRKLEFSMANHMHFPPSADRSCLCTGSIHEADNRKSWANRNTHGMSCFNPCYVMVRELKDAWLWLMTRQQFRAVSLAATMTNEWPILSMFTSVQYGSKTICRTDRLRTGDQSSSSGKTFLVRGRVAIGNKARAVIFSLRSWPKNRS